MTSAATHLSRSVPIWLYAAFGLVTTTAVVSIAMYVKQFGIAPAVDHDIWGQFGDFVGGIPNPMVSFAALALLARTYLLQRQEMADTSAALQNQARSFEAQRREARFFDLLRLYQDTLNQISFKRPDQGSAHEGKRALTEFVGLHLDGVETYDPESATTRKQIYALLVERNSYLLGHYFRVLFNILSSAEEILVEQRFRFVKLLRAQLSRDELVLIALNLLEGEGRKMRQLVAEYGLLKHLADGRLREVMRREFPLGCFGRKSEKLEPISL